MIVFFNKFIFPYEHKWVEAKECMGGEGKVLDVRGQGEREGELSYAFINSDIGGEYKWSICEYLMEIDS